MVKTPRLTTVGHGFDPWSGKFHTLQIVPPKGSVCLKRDREKKTSGDRSVQVVEGLEKMA